MQPKDPDELIVPAREGTLRVLRAALGAGVKRTVVTSSVAAIAGGARGPGPLTEEDWTDLDFPGLSPYVRSKTIAEQAAWELVEEGGARSDSPPSIPARSSGRCCTATRPSRCRRCSGCSKARPACRGSASASSTCVTSPTCTSKAMSGADAGGERFIAVAEFLWMAEVAAILRRELGADAERVPTRKIPDLLVKLMGRFDPSMRSIVNQLGKKLTYSSEKARSGLGWSPRPVERTDRRDRAQHGRARPRLSSPPTRTRPRRACPE